MNNNYCFLYILLSIMLYGCATYTPQYSNGKAQQGNDTISLSQKSIKTSFYLIGDAGGDSDGGSTYALEAFKKVIDTSQTEGDYVIFLGDNIYDAGLPKKNDKERAEAERRLDIQITAVENFKGNKLFIPGNHDWYSGGVQGVKRQEDYIEKTLGNNVFQPENGCPIEMISVNDDIELMLLDTQWYLEDWDAHPSINDKCEIKTRAAFFIAIENEFKKNNEKTIVVAMHHPMYTNGVHGGKYSLDKHLYPIQKKIPLPGVASLVAQVRSQGGVSPQDRYHNKYNKLMKRLSTLAKNTDKIVFASGHEHSLQYIENNGLKQIVSGAGAKSSAASLGADGLFSYGGQGFAILDIFDDGSSSIKFYAANRGEPTLLYAKEVFKAKKEIVLDTFSSSFPSTVKATVYPPETIHTSGVYRSFWGDHYREVYGTPITANVATIDTLMGGFSVDRRGGGHQTRSLRLQDTKNRNFNLRAVRKSAVQFLQSVAFKDKFVEDEFRETFTEDVILDFYTSGHPFASLAIPVLSNAVGVLHTNPKLIYIPKHNVLGKYNENYGDELYFIEERPDNGFLDVSSFGNPDGIDSTADLYKNLRKDEKYEVDEPAYIRARIFDMLLGDWDRHADQWRWARFDKDGKKTYKPIPRDRDQVFSKFDGAFLGLLKTLIPAVKQFQNYDGDLKNIKWINEAGIKMDRALIKNSGQEIWKQQAQYIQDHLSDDVIEAAFKNIPKEVQHIGVEEIKENLKKRRGHIVSIANQYASYLNKLVVITGTDKDDHFEIKREDNETLVTVSRIKNGEVKKPYITRRLQSNATKDLWLYGLDDKDTFHVSGTGKNPIRIKLIGGQEKDSYTIENGRKVKVFEHKTKKNTIVEKDKAIIVRTNDYSLNTYDPLKKKDTQNVVIPAIGSNPDDGLLIGITDIYTTKGFKNDPFTSRHTFKGGYYFATEGFDLNYDGIFTNVINKWGLISGARFTNGSFARNFFGLGNETINDEDNLSKDFNRVRHSNIAASLGLSNDKAFGGTLSFSASFEVVEVERTEGRFIEIFDEDTAVFDSQPFLGVEANYRFVNADNPANPTRGMEFQTIIGAKRNLNNGSRMYGYVQPKLGFYNALSRNRKWVLKTLVQAHINIGDDFEFYQAATLGARTGLRGYRFDRFTGESAFAGSADLRYSFNRFRTAILPIQMGVFGGIDLGRVWVDGENSKKWHNDFGGGLWINMVETVSGQVGAFAGEDGMRIDFRFGVRL